MGQWKNAINTRGIWSFGFNSSGGAFAGELVASLSAIGANRTADIYKKALENFTCELPADDELRSKLLDELLTDEISKIFASCDRQFYEYLDNLEMLVYQFIINKKVVLNEQKGGSIVEMFPPLLCLLLLRWPAYWSTLLTRFRGYVTALTGRALEWHSRGQRFDPAYLDNAQ